MSRIDVDAYGLSYAIFCVMFFRIVGIACDGDAPHCSQEVTVEGRDATMAKATQLARSEGWAISHVGHYCPQHRQRKGTP